MSNSSKQSFSTTNRAFAALALWSYRFKWLVMLLCLVVLGGSAYLASSIRMDNSFESFFDASDETYNAYKVYRENFGSDEIAYIMYDASSYPGGVFNRELIEKIHSLSEQIPEKVPFVDQVRSITNAELMIGEEDELIIRRIEEELPLTQEQLNDFAERFKKKSIYVSNLFDEDLKYGAILVEMTLSSTDPADLIRYDPDGGDGLENMYPQVSGRALTELLEQPEFADIPFYVSGDVPLNTSYNTIVDNEILQLGGTTMVIIMIILAIFFRGKIIGVVGPMSVVVLATLMVVAFLVVMGWNMDMMFAMAPTLLLAIGVAHSVHIISEFKSQLRRNPDREKALYNTLYLVGTPCLLTSLTTAAGFASMSSAPIKTISHMAIYMSVGVLFAFFLSITLLTFFLAFMKVPQGEEIKSSKLSVLDRVLRASTAFSLKYPKSLVAGFGVLLVVSVAGLSFIKIDSNYLLDFSDRVQVKLDTQYIDNTMGGMSSFAYLFDAKTPGSVKEPAFLKELERVQNEINSHQPLIRKTTSLVDLIKDLNQSFHGEDPAYYRIPDNRELISQYLLVYELSGGEDLFSYVTEDYSQALLQMRVQLTNSSVLADFDQEIQQYLDENPIALSEKSATGIGALWLKLINYISDSQMKGLSIAVVVITILISFIFGSLKLGLVSMVPNIFPILIVGGIMGWMGVYLDYSKLFIAPIAIGIAVDDTIHMMTRFKLEFERLGNYKEAYKATIHEVGKALVITSVTLVLGFSAMLFSLMTAQVWFGILISLSIILALLADIFVTPLLVIWLKPFGKEKAPEADSLVTAQS